MGIEPVTPSEVPTPMNMSIDEPGGPIDRINNALRKPWRQAEIQVGRDIEAHLGGANRNRATVEAVVRCYTDAGWIVRFDGSRGGVEDSFLFLPKEIT